MEFPPEPGQLPKISVVRHPHSISFPYLNISHLFTQLRGAAPDLSAATYCIAEESHTLGNALRWMLMKKCVGSFLTLSVVADCRIIHQSPSRVLRLQVSLRISLSPGPRLPLYSHSILDLTSGPRPLFAKSNAPDAHSPFLFCSLMQCPPPIRAKDPRPNSDVRYVVPFRMRLEVSRSLLAAVSRQRLLP